MGFYFAINFIMPYTEQEITSTTNKTLWLTVQKQYFAYQLVFNNNMVNDLFNVSLLGMSDGICFGSLILVRCQTIILIV